jgi:hypothetical protein
MPEKLSRRELALAVAAAVPAAAQTSPPPQAAPPAAEDVEAAAREQVQRYSELLAKTEVPILLEPSFTFRP